MILVWSLAIVLAIILTLMVYILTKPALER